MTRVVKVITEGPMGPSGASGSYAPELWLNHADGSFQTVANGAEISFEWHPVDMGDFNLNDNKTATTSLLLDIVDPADPWEVTPKESGVYSITISVESNTVVAGAVVRSGLNIDEFDSPDEGAQYRWCYVQLLLTSPGGSDKPFNTQTIVARIASGQRIDFGTTNHVGQDVNLRSYIVVERIS